MLDCNNVSREFPIPLGHDCWVVGDWHLICVCDWFTRSCFGVSFAFLTLQSILLLCCEYHFAPGICWSWISFYHDALLFWSVKLFLWICFVLHSDWVFWFWSSWLLRSTVLSSLQCLLHWIACMVTLMQCLWMFGWPVWITEAVQVPEVHNVGTVFWTLLETVEYCL